MLRSTWPLSFMKRPGGGPSLPANVIAYQSAPSGGMFDFPSLSFSGYQHAVLYLDELTVDTANSDLRLFFYISGSLVSTGYHYNVSYGSSGTAPSPSDSTSSGGVRLSNGVDTGSNIAFAAEVQIFNPDFALAKLVAYQTTGLQDSGSDLRSFGGGGLANNGSITGIRVACSSTPQITGGKAMLVGYPTS